jgi:hypothetical protein
MKKTQLNKIVKLAAILVLGTVMFFCIDLLNYRSTSLTLLGYLVEIGGIAAIVLITYSIIKNQK